MKKHINRLTTVIRKLNFVHRFLNNFPEPDYNIRGCFHDKEFIEEIERKSPPLLLPPDIESPTWCEPAMGNVSFI